MMKGNLRQTDRQHNYGIDLLKIISMLFITTIHTIGFGKVYASTTEFSLNYEIIWLLYTVVNCGVNCYAIISGYLIYGKENIKYRNIISLWFTVAFYSFLLPLGLSVLLNKDISVIDALKTLMPVSTNQYWYFTSYFCMFFFIPCLDSIVKNVSKKRMNAIFISVFFLFCVIETVTRHQNIFGINSGFTPVWLAICYMIGAYIKKYNIAGKFSRGKLALFFIANVVISWLSKFVIEIGTNAILGRVISGNLLVCSYTSFTVLFQAIALFLIFVNLNITGGKKLISFFAPATFGVYLISDNAFVRENLMMDRFSSYANLNVILMIFYVIITVVMIYIVCSLIDIIRMKVFNLIRINKFSEWIENRLRKVYNFFYLKFSDGEI